MRSVAASISRACRPGKAETATPAGEREVDRRDRPPLGRHPDARRADAGRRRPPRQGGRDPRLHDRARDADRNGHDQPERQPGRRPGAPRPDDARAHRRVDGRLVVRRDRRARSSAPSTTGSARSSPRPRSRARSLRRSSPSRPRCSPSRSASRRCRRRGFPEATSTLRRQHLVACRRSGDLAVGQGDHAPLRGHRCPRRRVVRRRGGADLGPDRPERRRQDDGVQRDHAPLHAGRGRARARRRVAAPDPCLPHRRAGDRADVPEHQPVQVDVGARERPRSAPTPSAAG